jgi:hypothetical protein
VPVAPFPPLYLNVPTLAEASPALPGVFELSATLCPPFAITVAEEPNHESPPAEVEELPAPTLTVYDAPGVTEITLLE